MTFPQGEQFLFDLNVQGPQRSTFFSEKKPTPHRRLEITTALLLENARVLYRHQENSLAALLLREALNQNSRHPAILRLLADTLFRMKKHHENKKVLTALCEEEVGFENLARKAHNLYYLGEDEQALPVYYEALALIQDDQSNLYEVYKNLGNIYVRQGDFDAAEENYNKAFTRFPTSDVLLVNYGTLEVQKGDMDKALYCYRQAIENNPLNDRAWVGLGLIHSHFGDQDLAWGNLVQALDINGANRTALILIIQNSNNEERLCMLTDKFSEYLYCVQTDSEISLLFVQHLIKQGHHDLARLELTKAYCFDPGHEELNRLAQEVLHGF